MNKKTNSQKATIIGGKPEDINDLIEVRISARQYESRYDRDKDISIPFPLLLQRIYDWLSPRDLTCAFEPVMPSNPNDAHTICFWFPKKDEHHAELFGLTFGGEL